MKTLNGAVIAMRPHVPDDDIPDDVYALCICAEVPDDKRIDVQQRRYNETSKKWRWVCLDTTHQDCPIHGLERKDIECPED